MQIIVDENKVVLGYCKGDGKVDGGIEVNDIPSDFEPCKYLFDNGQYVFNSNFFPDIVPAETEPTVDEIIDVLLGVSE